ncbi:MAG: SusC/RagA family TonB-linked outer membrane protein [Candidatus Marinimicrobia bacterium]|nr:SusC/RagA family TonB-linked outer membrane protein [Candidatus Neomarinimicrobiota bacterium]
MRILKTILFVSLTVGIAFGAVSGTVSDAKTGEPLVGTSVFVKGTFIGTTTDVRGAFSIEADPGDILMVAYIGYKTQEITVNGDVLDISLETDVLRQDEVVVTGLATTVKRRNAANAVAVITGDELVNVPTQTLDGALSGKFAGVNIRRNTGAPGGGINVNLRGSSTLTGSTQPLYVIDGIIVNNDANQSGIDVVTAATGAGSSRPQGQPTNRIGDINPNDIASIEILKGASAAALYGAKASNGVIIINTKRGRGGKTKFSYSAQYGTSELLKKMGHRVFETYDEAEEQYGADIASLGNDDNGNWAKNDFDYEGILYGETGRLVEHTFSAVGGNERTQFYISGQYMDEGGIIKNTGYQKISGRVNLDHRFSDKAKVSISTNIIRTNSDRGVTGNDNTNVTYGFSIGFTPSFIDIRQNADGSFPTHPTNPSNPLETAEYFVNNELTHRALASLQFDYSIFQQPTQSLKFVAVAGADFYNQENKVFSPPFLQIEESKTDAGQSVMTTTDNLNTNLYLNLVHKMKMSGMSFNTTVGQQYETRDRNSVFVHATGMVPTQQNIDQASAQKAYHTRTKQQDRGIFIQEEVSVGDNIYLAFGARGDKSSTMGNTEDLEWYPKMAASYQFGEVAGLFDNLKLRFARGETGNMPSTSAKYSAMNLSNIGGVNGLLTSSVKGNPDIKPERTVETEFGVDFSIMDGFASVEATMYTQNITDLILLVDMPASSGFSSSWENGGEMETKGIELSVTLNPTKLVSLGGLDWIFRTNYYTTSSEVTKLTVDPYNYGGFATFLGTYRIEEGWSPSAIVGSEMQLDANDDPIYKVYKHLGDPKKFDAADTIYQHVELGNETPDFQVSFFNSFKFGPVEFSFLIDHKKGGHAIDLAKLIYDLGGTTADYDKKSLDLDEDGVKSGDGAERLAVLGGITAPYIGSTTYTILREINLNYTLPKNLSDALGVSYLRVGISGRNIWMGTDYTGLSPEMSQFGNEAVGGSVDTAPFPQAKSFYFNLSIGI